MKQLLILMNCLGSEIKEYLSHIPEIRNNYNITLIITYTNLNNPAILDSIAKCDILLTNNIKSYEHLTYESLKKLINPTCTICKIEFIRFDGFYPTLPYIFHTNFLAVYDDSTKSTSYTSYRNYTIDDAIIINNFNSSLIKFRELDNASDIKFYDFFIENYKTISLFRDNNHMSSFFIKYIIKQILQFLNIKTNVNVDDLHINYGYGHKFRVKPVLDCVKRKLELLFDTETINIYNINIPIQNYYSFIQEVKDYTSIDQCEHLFMSKYASPAPINDQRN